LTCFHAASVGHPEAWLAELAVPVGWLLRGRPVLGAMGMVAGGAWLRVMYLGFPETSDQLMVARAALDLVLAGGNPYGIGYEASMPPGAPFIYGPLAVLAGGLRVPGEALAAVGILALLAGTRSWLTLAVYAAFHAAVQFGTSGINDQVPAFLLFAGLVALERRRLVGGLLIAISAAFKPYSLAWFLPAMGYGGVMVAVTMLLVSAALWSPLLVWGPASFLRSAEMAAVLHAAQPPQNGLNVPVLRILAVPLAVASVFVRRWWLVVVSGAAVFCVALFLNSWASYGYWFVVLPPLGMLVERWWRERPGQAAVRAPVERAAATAAPSS
jgi:hypothetical protein